MTRTRWGTLTLAVVAGIVGLAGPAAAAVPAVQPVQGVVADCDSLLQQIDALNAHVEALQEVLATAEPAQKPALIKKIGQMEVKIGILERKLASCSPSA
jgi:hypothetical protein